MLTLVGSVFSVASNIQPSYGSHEDIEVNLDDIEYGQGDDVTITGTIDGADEDEDVDITIHEPGTGSDDANTQISNDDGDFDEVYSIPNSAEDGVYQVEVEFGTEDPVFTFFYIDEDSDNVDFTTDELSYAPGDNVEITGDVGDTDTGIDEVEITVIDPTGEEFVSSADADLDNSDEFEYDFDLDDDFHGRYAIIIEYNDEESGWFVIEVEEDGGSSGNSITASLSSTSYEPGDEVEITGEVEDIEPGDDVVITVEDPDGAEIFNDAEAPDTDRSFAFSFDLDEDAETGTYEVTIEYISSENQEVLTFTVSTGSSGGGGGTGSTSGSSGGLTARLNKGEFLAGETVTITGVVPTIQEDDPVNISIIGPDGMFAGAVYPIPESDKSYSASLRLKSSLEPDEDYRAVISYDNKEVTLNFDITGVSTDGGPLTVKTDKTTYSKGSTVRITGEISEDLPAGKKVIIQAENPDGDVYRYDVATPSSDGSYSYSMVLGGDLEVNGEWIVTAFYEGEESETTFQLGSGGTGGGGTPSKPKFNLEVDGEIYPIEYEVTGGSVEIEEMIINYVKKKLVISVNADEDGELMLVLPREVIDAVEGDGSDIEYIVTTRDNAVGDDVVVDVSESETDDEARTLVIDVEAGTDIIEIAGTTIVPEFGPISMIILAIAIVGMIAATAKFSGRSNFFRH